MDLMQPVVTANDGFVVTQFQNQWQFLASPFYGYPNGRSAHRVGLKEKQCSIREYLIET